MKTSALSIKIDPNVKREAQKVADSLGFSLSAIVNASLKDLARRKTVSYSLLEPNNFLKSVILSARSDRARGRTAGHFSRVSDLMKSLNS